ncbi:MAG: hypothetical protein QM714_06905 [Nocardioides sp.]|uniref:acetyl-CoA carboxylase biotin carboxyl carrier protein n=1 Tax=Nocardioides sp. TaxID=35761 RepID=UPI0039E59527
MKLSDLKRLADTFEKSDWDEVHFVSDGVEIRLSTGAVAAPPPSTAIPGPAAAPSAEAEAAEAEVAVPNEEPSNVPAVGPEASTDDPAVGVPVLSATPGIFYRAPAPDAPPFVEVGDRVGPDTPIGIVEVMKLMNRVTAGTRGVVVAIVANNGQQVEQGAVLIRVAEDD